uniref:Uncharacterized protein n=1 Tax=Arundo donax TaxID=35708 RepID=A0A0A8YM73_ARUDO
MKDIPEIYLYVGLWSQNRIALRHIYFVISLK